MGLDTISVVYSLEQAEDYHISRLLLLISHVQALIPTGIEGLTKLAKLDFLVRYPTVLRRALQATGRKTPIDIEPHELQSVESSMVRYKYGPWDHKYKRILSNMKSRHLVVLTPGSRTVLILLDKAGAHASSMLASSDQWALISDRCAVVAKYFGDFRGTRLKDFIYQTIPELKTMRMNEEIDADVY